ncbi:MAG: sugar metabolism transcriptional regulator [Deltaproteobacteria bacterium]|nr:MAG: sugar metabolism transcriptional regulator [Deltaproteobacteria bacterium]
MAILSEIKKYLKQRGQASLEEIAIHFGSEPGAIQEMLGILIKKGSIEKYQPSGGKCGSCCGCSSGDMAIYCWKG